MAALIDEGYVRATFNIHKDVETTRITPYITVAGRRLVKWVGATVHASANSEIQEVLKLAEATLTMHFLIRNLNTNMRPKGLVATEIVEGNVTMRYLNPTEVSQSETDYLNQAEELVRDLILDSSVPPAPEIVKEA